VWEHFVHASAIVNTKSEQGWGDYAKAATATRLCRIAGTPTACCQDVRGGSPAS